MQTLEHFKIRPLETSDRVKILQMLTQCGENTRTLFRPIHHFYNLEGVNWLFNTLNSLNPHRFVAENMKGEVIGFIYYYPKGDDAYLALLVQDAYQRKGIGNSLIKKVEEHARNKGLTSMFTGGGTKEHGPLYNLLSKRGYVDLGKYTETHCMMRKKL